MKLDNRIWAVITVVACGALLAGAWFLGASPFLNSAATAQTAVAQVSQQNTQTEAENQQLKKSQAEEATLKSKLATLRKAVPEGVDATSFISEVNSTAAGSGVSVISISLSTPVAYSPPVTESAAATPSAPGATASPSATATPTPSATPTGPVAPTPTSNSLITGSNFVVVPVDIVVTGSADQASTFLKGIQHGERLFLVTQLSRADQESGGVELTIKGSIYVVKDSTRTSAAANG